MADSGLLLMIIFAPFPLWVIVGLLVLALYENGDEHRKDIYGALVRHYMNSGG